MSGSATPQKTIPTPKPAENNIPSHDMKENSGSSLSSPNLNRPYLEAAKEIRKISKINIISKKSQPKVFEIKSYIV